jgi:hypothetical protein
MKRNNTEIQHPSQLNSLTSFSMFRGRGRGRISLSSTFDHPNKKEWESQLNRNYYACGCDSGAKGLMIFLAAGVTYVFLFKSAGEIGIVKSIFMVIGISLLGAFLGKSMGLIYANRRLKRTINAIQSNWKTEDRKDSEMILCG